MYLHRRIPAVAIDGRRPAEDEAARTAIEDGRADLRLARVQRDRRLRHPGLEERLRQPPRRPRLLRPGFQHQPDLQRQDRQPQAMHPRGIRRQHQAEHGTGRLVAAQHVVLVAEPTREDVEIELSCQRGEDLVELREHAGQLLHVHPAQMLWQPGRRRLLSDEPIRRLRRIPDRQIGRHEQLAGTLDHPDELGTRNLAEHIARPLGFPHVTRYQAGIRLTHLRHRLARGEVGDRGHVEAAVRLAPPQHREMNHVSRPPLSWTRPAGRTAARRSHRPTDTAHREARAHPRPARGSVAGRTLSSAS